MAVSTRRAIHPHTNSAANTKNVTPADTTLANTTEPLARVMENSLVVRCTDLLISLMRRSWPATLDGSTWCVEYWRCRLAAMAPNSATYASLACHCFSAVAMYGACEKWRKTKMMFGIDTGSMYARCNVATTCS